jgi:Putative beta-barrel porin 2
MTTKHISIAILAASCTLGKVRGQGLMDIGRPVFEDGARLPFSLSVSSAAGWDSEPGAGSSTGSGSQLPSDGPGSAFWENAIDLYYPVGHGRSRLNIRANYSGTLYFDPPPGTQEFQNIGGLHLDYFRQINQRLSITDSAHLSYQTEPNYQIGASINRPTSGYYYGSNTFRASYNWSTRFSTVTSYTASFISYDDEALQDENNNSHLFSESLRYSLTRRTTALLDYRYSFTTYPDNPAADSQSHFILLGANRPLGRFLSMSLSGGAEFRSYDGPLGSETAPYGEAAINYHARENTTLRLYYRGGLEDTGTAGLQSNFSHRTGLAMTHRFTPRLSLDLAVDNVNSEVSDGPVGAAASQGDLLHARAGLTYSRPLWRRLNLNASYSFSTVSSDDPFAEYERHRVSLGVSGNF